MVRITVTAKNNEEGLKYLKEFEDFIRSRYTILCKSRMYTCRSRCRNLCPCPYKANSVLRS